MSPLRKCVYMQLFHEEQLINNNSDKSKNKYDNNKNNNNYNNNDNTGDEIRVISIHQCFYIIFKDLITWPRSRWKRMGLAKDSTQGGAAMAMELQPTSHSAGSHSCRWEEYLLV